LLEEENKRVFIKKMEVVEGVEKFVLSTHVKVHNREETIMVLDPRN
jgi:hypothetical protein